MKKICWIIQTKYIWQIYFYIGTDYVYLLQHNSGLWKCVVYTNFTMLLFYLILLFYIPTFLLILKLHVLFLGLWFRLKSWSPAVLWYSQCSELSSVVLWLTSRCFTLLFLSRIHSFVETQITSSLVRYELFCKIWTFLFDSKVISLDSYQTLAQLVFSVFVSQYCL